MSLLCLASGTLAIQIAASTFTLAWTHSIEKVRWEEDWRVDGAQLVLIEARVRGSGAGMEPPDGAKLVSGVWHYPGALNLDRLTLAHSPFAQAYTLCTVGGCKPLGTVLPGLPAIATVELAPCLAPGRSEADADAPDRSARRP